MPDASIVNHPAVRRWAVRTRTLAALYLVVLFVATHVPLRNVTALTGSDKIAHFLAYAMLTFVVLLAWEPMVGRLKAKHYIAALLVGAIYGAFDEITQIPVGRTADVQDWLADVAGILVGLAGFRLVRAWLYRIFIPESPLATWE